MERVVFGPRFVGSQFGIRDLGLGCGIQALLNRVGGGQGITGEEGAM